MAERSEVLLIGGRSGVGKSAVGYELSTQLAAADVRHALIEGDNLDMAYPLPWEYGLAEKNLAAMWRNYRAVGYQRLIYLNTASVLVVERLLAAMDDDPRPVGVLLTASDATARERLARREVGGALEAHVERGRRAATDLAAAPGWVIRVNTDDRSVADVARQLAALTGWLAPRHPAAR